MVAYLSGCSYGGGVWGLPRLTGALDEGQTISGASPLRINTTLIATHPRIALLLRLVLAYLEQETF